MADPLPALKPIPVKERFSVLYVEKGHLDVLDGAFVVVDKTGVRTHVPVGGIACLMLEPGTRVSHAACALAARVGTLLVWIGEAGVRLYSAGQPGGARADRLLYQAKLALDPALRLKVVRKMYAMRFGEEPPQKRSVEQLRGIEGARVREMYRQLARKYGVEKTLVLSTYHVYGASAFNPALIDESAPLKAAGLTMDLVDSVELENLAQICLWKFPELNMTILRPCNIVGPGVKNAISTLLADRNTPVLAGFSPMMQFLHIDDMADAIVLAFNSNRPGIYNVADDDWVAYQTALKACGCRRIPLPSVPPGLSRRLASLLGIKGFPPYLLNYYKYPVIIDGTAFRTTFGFQPRYTLAEIFSYYRAMKH